MRKASHLMLGVSWTGRVGTPWTTGPTASLFFMQQSTMLCTLECKLLRVYIMSVTTSHLKVPSANHCFGARCYSPLRGRYVATSY